MRKLPSCLYKSNDLLRPQAVIPQTWPDVWKAAVLAVHAPLSVLTLTANGKRFGRRMERRLA
jgi:hypothetical protein